MFVADDQFKYHKIEGPDPKNKLALQKKYPKLEHRTKFATRAICFGAWKPPQHYIWRVKRNKIRNYNQTNSRW